MIIVLRRQEALKHTYTTARAATTFFAQNVVLLIPPPSFRRREKKVLVCPLHKHPFSFHGGSQKVRTRRRRLRTHFSGCRRRGVAFGGGSSKQFLLSFSAFLAKFVCVCAEMFMTGGNCQKSPEGRILGGEKGWGAAADGLSSPFLLNYRAEGWRLPLIKFPPPVPSLERAATRPSLSRKIDLGGKRTKGEEEEFHGHRRFRSFPQLGRPEKGELNTCMSLPTLAIAVPLKSTYISLEASRAGGPERGGRPIFSSSFVARTYALFFKEKEAGGKLFWERCVSCMSNI